MRSADRIEARPKDPGDLTRTAQVLEEATGAPTIADRESGKATVPAGDALASLSLALKALENAQIRLDDLELRRPTLDDAFLALTDRGKENA